MLQRIHKPPNNRFAQAMPLMIRLHSNIDNLIEQTVADYSSHPDSDIGVLRHDSHDGVGKTSHGGGNTSRAQTRSNP